MVNVLKKVNKNMRNVLLVFHHIPKTNFERGFLMCSKKAFGIYRVTQLQVNMCTMNVIV